MKRQTKMEAYVTVNLQMVLVPEEVLVDRFIFSPCRNWHRPRKNEPARRLPLIGISFDSVALRSATPITLLRAPSLPTSKEKCEQRVRMAAPTVGDVTRGKNGLTVPGTAPHQKTLSVSLP